MKEIGKLSPYSLPLQFGRRIQGDRALLERRLSGAVFALVLLAISGCATVDFDQPKAASYAAADAGDTWLGQRVAGLTGDRAGESGFMLLHSGVEAMAARVSLANRAELTIDAQYYLVKADTAGLLFLNALLNAADRGVRVRLLIDDFLATGQDPKMLALDAHPNFEIRIFNPFARRSRFGRTINVVGDFRRLNRRMHNKSFIADNQVTVIGGRNIGSEYFAAHDRNNFEDLDLLGIGPMAKDVSTMFDRYWNDRMAVPIHHVVRPPEDPEKAMSDMRERITAGLADVSAARYQGVVEGMLERERIQQDQFTWDPYELVYDPPEFGDKRKAATAESMVPALQAAISKSEEEFLLVTPYFVPRRKSLALFKELLDRGVAVKTVTNSLASTNQPIVHSGYGPKRKSLLRMGVEVYELRPDFEVTGLEESGVEESGGGLHAKLFIIDRTELFVGSFNWDPRSARINTEMGIILHSPELAAGLARRITSDLKPETYQLELSDNGRLRWVTWIDGEEVVYTKEPHTSWWQRFKVGFYRILPIKEQL